MRFAILLGLMLIADAICGLHKERKEMSDSSAKVLIFALVFCIILDIVK